MLDMSYLPEQTKAQRGAIVDEQLALSREHYRQRSQARRDFFRSIYNNWSRDGYPGALPIEVSVTASVRKWGSLATRLSRVVRSLGFNVSSDIVPPENAHIIERDEELNRQRYTYICGAGIILPNAWVSVYTTQTLGAEESGPRVSNETRSEKHSAILTTAGTVIRHSPKLVNERGCISLSLPYYQRPEEHSVNLIDALEDTTQLDLIIDSIKTIKIGDPAEGLFSAVMAGKSYGNSGFPIYKLTGYSSVLED